VDVVTGPLTGVRIVMMGGLGPAPFCGMLLGDLGADVIRVDALAGVDGPPPIDYTVRRSQRSLAADVKDPRGRILDSPGCCATPVLSLSEAPRHPHFIARETFVDVDGITQPAPAPRFSRTRPATPSPPSLPGDHTHALLRELGLDSEAVAALVDAGVVAQSDREGR